MTTPETQRLEKLIEKVWGSQKAAEEMAKLYNWETKTPTDAGMHDEGYYAARYQGQAKAFEQVLTELRAFQAFTSTGNWGNK